MAAPTTGPEYRSHATDKRHENDLAGHAPMHIRQRRELRYDRFRSSGHSGQGSGQNEDRELVARSAIAERDRARLVIANGFENLAERRMNDPVDEQEADHEDRGDEVIEGPVVAEIDETEGRRRAERPECRSLRL